jgi:hypothetical protein
MNAASFQMLPNESRGTPTACYQELRNDSAGHFAKLSGA